MDLKFGLATPSQLWSLALGGPAGVAECDRCRGASRMCFWRITCRFAMARGLMGLLRPRRLPNCTLSLGCDDQYLLTALAAPAAGGPAVGVDGEGCARTVYVWGRHRR